MVYLVMAQAAARGEQRAQEEVLRGVVERYFECDQDMPALPRPPAPTPAPTAVPGECTGGAGEGAGPAAAVAGEEEGGACDGGSVVCGGVRLPIQMAPERAGPQVAAFLRTLRDRILTMVGGEGGPAVVLLSGCVSRGFLNR